MMALNLSSAAFDLDFLTLKIAAAGCQRHHCFRVRRITYFMQIFIFFTIEW